MIGSKYDYRRTLTVYISLTLYYVFTFNLLILPLIVLLLFNCAGASLGIVGFYVDFKLPGRYLVTKWQNIITTQNIFKKLIKTSKDNKI